MLSSIAHATQENFMTDKIIVKETSPALDHSISGTIPNSNTVEGSLIG